VVGGDSPAGTWLATSGNDRTLRIWDAATGTARTIRSSHSGTVGSVAIAPDSTWLATADTDGTVRIWDTATEKCVASMRVDDARYGCAWTPDGTDIALVGAKVSICSPFVPATVAALAQHTPRRPADAAAVLGKDAVPGCLTLAALVAFMLRVLVPKTGSASAPNEPPA
jgi:hypothetical protein